MAADLRIWLLGGFRAELGTEPVPAHAWRRSRATALVKLLALSPGHRLHRELVMETLWPETDPDVSAAGLRKALHFARQALTADHLRIRDQLVALQAPAVWTDVEAFEAALSSGDTAGALSLYAGDLLPEDRFEPWTDELRQRLRRRLAELLLHAAAEAERRGDRRLAATSLERLVALDPLDERAAAALMRLQAASGHRHLALRTYRGLEDRLRDDLGVSPDEDLLRLRDDVAAGRIAVTPPGGEGAPPPAEDAEPAAPERKLVTALWVDVGVPVAAHADPEHLQRETDARCAAATTILEGWGASVERLVGGSLLALFGVPTAHEDDAVRALHAGVDLLGDPALASAVRIGVETGEVLVGDTALPRAVAGASLDVAGKLREAAAPGTLLAGVRTRNAARSAFRFAAHPVTDAAGTSGAGTAYRLLGDDAAGSAIAAAAAATPMVGRDAEMSAILSLAGDAIAGGRPRLIAVIGAAGVGKSRLVREAVAAITVRHQGCRILRGRCISTANGVTDWALGEVVRDVCGIPFGEAGDAGAARLRATVGELLAGEAASAVDAVVSALAVTAGITLPGNPLAHAAPADVGEALAVAWPRLASAMAARGPVVMVVEDLHWAGERLVQMLERIATRAGGPLVVMVTARPEMLQEHPGFGTGGDTTSSITLQGLTATASDELLAALPAAAALSDVRRRQVLARADGNPYFIEELVSHLAEGAPEAIPDSLRAVLAARVDALPAAEKRVLQEASVVGRVFWSEPLARALGRDVEDAVAALERRGLVLRRGSSGLAGHHDLAFKHALLRDVAYASIPLSRRARAHAGVAEWIEGLSGDRQALTELLAHHCACAAAEPSAWAEGAEREAIRASAYAHLMDAGVAACHRYALRKAVELHGRALEMAGADDERLRALEALGDDHACAFEGDAAERCYRDALELTRAQPGLAASRARLCGKLALLMGDMPGAFHHNPRAEVAEALVAEGLESAAGEVDRARVLLARGAAARLYRGSEPFGQGDQADPVAVDERIAGVVAALRVIERHGDPALLASADAVLAVLYGMAGRYAEMIELVDRELAAELRAPSRQNQLDSLRKRAELAVEVEGRFEPGLEMARRAYALACDEPHPHQLMHCTYAVIVALHRLGRWDEALGYVDEHAAAFREEPAAHCQSVLDGTVVGAVTLAHRGCVERARELFALTGNPADDIAGASAWQARYALVSGDAELATAISEPKAFLPRQYSPQHTAVLLDALADKRRWDALASVLRPARSQVSGNALLAPTADRAQALLCASRDDNRGALRAMRRALRGFDSLGEAHETACTGLLLAEMEPDPDRSRSLRDVAMATAQRLGAVSGA